MRVTNPDEGEENSTSTNQSEPVGNGGRKVRGPEAAAKATVDRMKERVGVAEREVEETQKDVDELRQRNEELREENEELRELAEKAIAGVRRVDEHLTQIEENVGAWGNEYETEEIAELLELPEYEELEIVEEDQGGT